MAAGIITLLAASPTIACDVHIDAWSLEKGNVVDVTNGAGKIGQRISFQLSKTGGEVLHVISKTLLGQEMLLKIGKYDARPIMHNPIVNGRFVMEFGSIEEADYIEKQLKECL